MAIQIPTLECRRCGHTWVLRKEQPPVACPRCRSPYWQRPRRSERTPSRVGLDFGHVPVSAEPRAELLLSRLPSSALSPVLAAVQSWAKQAPVKRIAVIAVSEPEDRSWEEVVIEIDVAADFETWLALWDQLASAIDEAKSRISPQERQVLDRQFDVQLSRWEEAGTED